MKKLKGNYGIIKTQPIYYCPEKFEEYNIMQILTDDINPNNKIQEFNDSKRSSYIVGKRFISNSTQDFTSGQFSIRNYSIINDSSFLEDFLSAGYRLLSDDGSRSKDTDSANVVNIVLSLTRKYGLIHNDLLTKRYRKNHEPVLYSGCNLWSLVQGLETLSTTHMRMLKLQWEHFDYFNDKEICLSSVDDCVSTLRWHTFFDEKNTKFTTFLVANSLLDVAYYQLNYVISNNVYTRKCANPACPNVIIGGKSNRKTCCDACRMALSRLNKEQRSGVNGNT